MYVEGLNEEASRDEPDDFTDLTDDVAIASGFVVESYGG